MMFTLMLFACALSDPMKARAEHAALVCYDNGTLVYASETTVDDLTRIGCTTDRHAAPENCDDRWCFFTDKGVKFSTQTLDCVPRIPQEYYVVRDACRLQERNEERNEELDRIEEGRKKIDAARAAVGLPPVAERDVSKPKTLAEYNAERAAVGLPPVTTLPPSILRTIAEYNADRVAQGLPPLGPDAP